MLRMNAVALAMIKTENRRYDQALGIIGAVINKIEALTELDLETFQFERKRSLAALRDLAAQLEKNKPISRREKLERELQKAIAAQEFERAAELRDELRSLRKSKPH